MIAVSLPSWRKMANSFMAAVFLVTTTWAPQAEAQVSLPAPGTLVMPTENYAPVVVRGMTVNPKNPLQFDFLVDQGQEKVKDDDAFRREAARLVNYFMASLAIPEKDVWVNLSPYEGGRMVDEKLGLTEMGRDLLSQDYMLKQLASSLMFPEKELGREFWQRVYAKAQEKFGTTDVAVDTFHKVWIVPQKAVVYAKGNTAFILEAHLKVLMEEDYLARNRNSGAIATAGRAADSLSSDIMRDILLPEIEKEVNQGKTFAMLRQIYYSNILAAWFKRNLKASLLGKVYADKSRIGGIDSNEAAVNGQIYAQYVQAFQKGVFNYIKESDDPAAAQALPRKYFSGGTALAYADKAMQVVDRAEVTDVKGIKRVAVDMAEVTSLFPLKWPVSYVALLLRDSRVVEMKTWMNGQEVSQTLVAHMFMMMNLLKYVLSGEASSFKRKALIELSGMSTEDEWRAELKRLEQELATVESRVKYQDGAPYEVYIRPDGMSGQALVTFFSRHGDLMFEMHVDGDYRQFNAHDLKFMLSEAIKQMPHRQQHDWREEAQKARMGDDAENVGGVDLAESGKILEQQGAVGSFQFDAAQLARFERGDFTGFVPVITGVSLIHDLPGVLGAR